MNCNTIIKAVFVLGTFGMLVPSANAQAAYGNSSVKANVSVILPSAVTLTATDNVTTVQNLILDASNISFDQNLNASGSVSIQWKGSCNSNNGFSVTIQRSTVSGTAGTALLNDLSIRGLPVAGGNQNAVIAGAYVAGKALPAIPDANSEQFASTSASGSAIFGVELDLNSPARDGIGTAGTVLTFVGAAL